jgi:hypothetical protein
MPRDVEFDSRARVIAIAHSSMNPGYWKRRLYQ